MEHPSCTHQRRQNLPFTVSILEMKAPTVLLNAGLSLRKWIAIIHIQVWTNSLHRSNRFGPNETGILCTTRLILCCNWTDIGHQSERKSILFLPGLIVYIWCRVLWDGWCARWRAAVKVVFELTGEWVLLVHTVLREFLIHNRLLENVCEIFYWLAILSHTQRYLMALSCSKTLLLVSVSITIPLLLP